MKSLSIKLGVILIGLAIFGYAKGAVGDDRTSLQGLKRFYVLINGPFESFIGEGLTKEQLKMDIESQLRRAGIEVLTEEESVALPGTPYLSVTFQVSEEGICRVSLTHSSVSFYAIVILIQLHQEVRLDRNPDMKINGVTWKATKVGWVRAKEMKDRTWEYMKNGINSFMNDYSVANPPNWLKK